MHLFKPENRHVLAGAALIAATLPALSAPLLVNGGFESDAGTVQSPDAITGWSAAEAGLTGSVSSLNAASTPGSGRSTVGASSGSRYGLLDLSQPGYSVLYQAFTIGAEGITSGLLSYDLFATSFAGIPGTDLSSSQGLDPEAQELLLTLRVDILRAGADLLTTESTDIVKTYLPGGIEFFGDDDTLTPYSSYTQQLTSSDLFAGQTYTLRFAAAANAGQFVVGIDNVSIDVTNAVPEPQTCALVLTGLAAIAWAVRRRT